MIRYAEDRIGQRIGKYILERVLGRGGMSEVFFARDDRTGTPAAIKILQSDLPDNIEADRRLEQEARAIARINHPNVIDIYGYGKTDDGLPYIAMEYLDGQSLTQVMAAVRPMQTEQLLRIILQMLAGLECAHSLDIIHRDVKPDNVFLVEEDGQSDKVKMLDFGIAKLLGTQPHSLVHTVRGVVLGTPEYLPPEIAMELTVSPVTDLYAVGVILFEGLTGRLPFVGRGPAELAEHHCFTPPPRLRPLNPSIPPDLEQLVLRSLAKDPIKRYPSARALAEALEPFTRADTCTELSTRPMARVEWSPRVELGNVERILRQAVARHWVAHPAPDVLQRALNTLDEINDQAEATFIKMTALTERLSQPISVAHVTADLVEVNAEVQRLSGELSNMQEQMSELTCRIEDESAAIILVLEALGDGEGGTQDIQSILSGTSLNQIAQFIKKESVISGWIDARRTLALQMVERSEQRAKALEHQAQVEGQLLSVRAEQAGAQLRLYADRENARFKLDVHSQQRIKVLAQLAVDLAVAIGS